MGWMAWRDGMKRPGAGLEKTFEEKEKIGIFLEPRERTPYTMGTSTKVRQGGGRAGLGGRSLVGAQDDTEFSLCVLSVRCR